MSKQHIPGILLAIVLMLIAKLISGTFPNLGTALIALVLGMIFRQIIVDFSPYQNGVVWTEKYILESAIVLIGFGFQVDKLSEIGISTIGLIIGGVVLIMAASFFLKKLFGENAGLYWLLGAGSAICGSSAIAAAAPLIRAKEEEIGISMATINLLGLAGMILLPLLASLFYFSNVQTGIYIGGILQSVGHVIGASFSINGEVGEIATIVKMGRVSLLIPFLLIVFFIFRKKSDGSKLKFPLFIVFFLAAVLLSQTHFFTDQSIKYLSNAGDTLLNISMAAIGLKINIKSIWKISGKAFAAGLVLFLLQILIYTSFLLLSK